MNLCTDQLALMLAAPGQLVSVSWLAHDPDQSPMAEAARRLPANRGSAEDIVMLQPDLVLAGRFTTVATVAMLERLGIPVARFAPETSLDDVAEKLARMGHLLGREAEAEARIAAFRRDRAVLADHVARHAITHPEPERAALYFARGFTGGPASLAGDILRAAGLSNIAEDLGLRGGGHLALETLVLADPDRLVTGRRGAGHSEAQALLDHPALRSLPAQARGATATMTDRDWICGTPHVLDAVAGLVAAREGRP
ncbi:MAG: ABC transporter substrate-binding protein [Alkalilacustris sp.]